MVDTPKKPFEQLGKPLSGHINTGFNHDEFLPELRGKRAVKKYREMRDNDAIVGAVMHAMDMLLRAVEWKIEAANDSVEAKAEAEFVESVFDDMEHTFEETISDALTFLTYGWSDIETVFKRRKGPFTPRRDWNSSYNDGRIGVRRFNPIPQYTIDRFLFDEDEQVVAVVQRPVSRINEIVIPMPKLLHFKTASNNSEPTGRSVLRNAYRSYYFANHIEEIEGIAIERELNGLPMAYLPSEILNATQGENLAIREQFETILRDVKYNEQGFIMFPSELWEDAEGRLSDRRMAEFSLIASQGTRDIDTDKVITRYRQNIARTVLADFIMLGQNDRGSFALSSNKSQIFMRSLEGYATLISAVFNKQFLPRLWMMNGLDFELMPRMKPSEIEPVNLQQLGAYIQSLSQAGTPLFPNNDLAESLLEAADLPKPNPDETPVATTPSNEPIDGADDGG